MKKSYSKEGQDLFVNHFIPNKGYFIDIGCGDPIDGNNTYSLEENGWTGLLIDFSLESINKARISRKNPAFHKDITTIDWISFLEENNVPSAIDYLSIDVDDCNPRVLEKFPFDLYKVKIITYETDVYIRGQQRKEAEISFLKTYPEYKIIFEDGMVTNNNLIWEDWIINTSLIDIPIDKYYSSQTRWENYLNNILSI